MNANTHPSRYRQAIPDMLAFTLGLGAAWWWDWQTADLIWSLWLSSLFVGYATFVLTAFGALVLAGLVMTEPGIPPSSRIPGLIVILLGGAFFFAFFSVHFCAFHSGHASFLSEFFPLSGITASQWINTVMKPHQLLGLAWRELVPLYGFILIPMFMAERHHLLDKPLGFIRELWAARNRPHGEEELKDKTKEADIASGTFFRPYINVIRMHLLIFVFAGAHYFKLDNFLLFAIVYALYFFPWRLVARPIED